MSVSEKLVTIAENVPKVYEAGKTYAYTNPQTPTDDRKCLYAWFQYLNKNGEWDADEWDEDGMYVSYPEEDINNLYESLPYPQGTSSVLDFFQALTIRRYNDETCTTESLSAPTKKFTGVLDMSNAKDIFLFLGENSKVEDAGTIIFPQYTYSEEDAYYNYPTRHKMCFNRCTTITNLKVKGKLYNSLNTNNLPLNKESITSVINALEENVSGMTLTINKAAKEASFTADEWAALIETKSNWTISLI